MISLTTRRDPAHLDLTISVEMTSAVTSAVNGTNLLTKM